jgi:predicted neutral ceramidase superfamily lipid hydrolase
MPALSPAALLAIFSNIAFSIVLVLLNKRLVVEFHFKYMTVLSGLHFAASFLVCMVMIVAGVQKYKSVNSYWSIFRISLVWLATYFIMHLRYSTPPFAVTTGISAVCHLHELLPIAQHGGILPSSETFLHTTDAVL